MNIEQFKKEKSENSWFYSPDGDFEVFIKGDEFGPDQESYGLAEKLMPILEECKSKAIPIFNFLFVEGRHPEFWSGKIGTLHPPHNNHSR